MIINIRYFRVKNSNVCCVYSAMDDQICHLQFSLFQASK